MRDGSLRINVRERGRDLLLPRALVLRPVMSVSAQDFDLVREFNLKKNDNLNILFL